MAKAKKEPKASKKAKENSAVLTMDDLKGKTPDQLKDLVVGIKKEQFNNRFQRLTQGEGIKPHRARAIRKNVARIKTLINQSNKGAA